MWWVLAWFVQFVVVFMIVRWLLKRRRNAHRCIFSVWGEIEEIRTSTSFHSGCLWIQKRRCPDCGKIETRVCGELTT